MISADFTPDMIKKHAPAILVLGDIMLDQYVTGEVHRLAPEADVPVLSHTAPRTTNLGGAGFVAQIVAKLGATAYLCGVVGADAYGIVAKEIARSDSINVDGIISDGTRPTTIKTRFQKGRDLLLRVDDESTSALSMKIEHAIQEKIYAVANLAAIIISDYGKGVITESLCQNIIRTSQKYSGFD